MTSFTKLEEKLKEIVFSQDTAICGRKLKELEESFSKDTVFDEIGISTGTLTTVELIMELEDEFEIEIPDEEMDDLNTINKIITYLTTKHKIKNQ